MGLRAMSFRRLVFRRLDDETLLSHALEGQEAAFSELYARYRGLVYGYCLARLMNPSAAEDVTQDTFIRINASNNTQPIRSVRAWVFTVARSALVDHVRRQKREPACSPRTDSDLQIVAEGSDVAETASRREQARSVFLAIARLRPRYRSALLLREMHGLTSAEIGEAMNLKPGAVDTLVSRARDAFGREYAGLGDLPSQCRRAVEYVYRDRGTGIDGDERAWLESHIADCPRCAREQRTAGDARAFSLLLPLMSARTSGFGFLTRAIEVLGCAPGSTEAFSVMAAKVTMVVLATSVALSPLSAVPSAKSEVSLKRASYAAASPSLVSHETSALVPAEDVGAPCLNHLTSMSATLAAPVLLVEIPPVPATETTPTDVADGNDDVGTDDDEPADVAVDTSSAEPETATVDTSTSQGDATVSPPGDENAPDPTAAPSESLADVGDTIPDVAPDPPAAPSKDSSHASLGDTTSP